MTPITVSQRDVFPPRWRRRTKPSDLLLFFSFTLPILPWLSLPSPSLWWKMRGCSTCCHPTHLASPPPTYPLPLLRLQTTSSSSSSSSSCLFIISTADGGRLCGTFRAHLFTTFFSKEREFFFSSFWFCRRISKKERVVSFSVDGYISSQPPPAFNSSSQSQNHFSVFFVYLFIYLKPFFFLFFLFFLAAFTVFGYYIIYTVQVDLLFFLFFFSVEVGGKYRNLWCVSPP